MKKIFLNIITIFTIILITGCKTNKKQGESIEISLYTNSFADISWNYQIDQNDIIDISYDFNNKTCNPEAEGCDGQGIYTVTAKNPGTVILTFECFSDKKTAIYEITVNENLEISEKHYGTYFSEN